MKTRTLILAILFAGVVSLYADGPAVPAEGSAAPAFSLPSQDGAPVSLSEFHGKWVVLYFYPKDFTSGCTLEAHNFQRDIDKYQQKNAANVGVSVDPVDYIKGLYNEDGLNIKHS